MITVTITGADDEVDPEDLALLSEGFPFVEWAVLFSRKQEGAPRYPSRAWRACFYLAVLESKDQQGRAAIGSAVHLCGEIAREAMAGNEGRLRSEFWLVDRWQINGYRPGPDERLGKLAERCPRLVLQCRDFTSFEAYCLRAKELGCGATVLYDPSGGQGKREPWPAELINHGVPFGIAGGISPDNIESAIAAADRLGASWIDMESGVRTDDRFDLAKVRQVLARAVRVGAGP